MANLQFDDLVRQCRTQKLAPLYLWWGTEKYRHREALNLLCKTLLAEETQLFNYSEVSVAAEGIAGLLTVAAQYPMFDKFRLVIARDFDKVDNQELEQLKDYLRAPIATTILVFQTEALDKRRNIAAVLLKGCTVIELSPLKDRDAQVWITNYVQAAGYQIMSNSIGALLAYVGTDLFSLQNELEKLMAYVGKTGVIKVADVENLVANLRHHNGFELADALLMLESKRALRLLAQQLRQQDPLAILGLLVRTLRQIVIAKDLIQQKRPAEEVVKEAGIPAFRSTEFFAQARRWSADVAAEGLIAASQLDNDLKNGIARPDLQLEIFLYRLLRQATLVK
jgi:DNA polymerase III subunit delta